MDSLPHCHQHRLCFLTGTSTALTLRLCLECKTASILNSSTPRFLQANSCRLPRRSCVASTSRKVDLSLLHILDILSEFLPTTATSSAAAVTFLGLGLAVFNMIRLDICSPYMSLIQAPQYRSRSDRFNTMVASSPRPVSKVSQKLSRPLRIFVGYDSREDLAYEVCKYTLLKHATIAVDIVPIKQHELRKAGLYTRFRDVTESTEFSFTRFLTPFLAGYEGWALFIDCDFLYTADVRELVELIDDRYAVMCVQHDYTPTSTFKMDGCVQTSYPRKNWSSMVLYNCSHRRNQVLTPAIVNSQTGAFLHRFLWLDDEEIGSIPYTWNFLVGHNEIDGADENGNIVLPKALHYTSGGPWFEAWKDCAFAHLWFRARDEYLSSSERTAHCRCNQYTELLQ